MMFSLSQLEDILTFKVLLWLVTICNPEPPKSIYSIYIYKKTVMIVKIITFAIITTTHFLSKNIY